MLLFLFSEGLGLSLRLFCVFACCNGCLFCVYFVLFTIWFTEFVFGSYFDMLDLGVLDCICGFCVLLVVYRFQVLGLCAFLWFVVQQLVCLV